MKKFIGNLLQGFIVLTLIPVMVILGILEMVDKLVFGEGDDYEQRG